MTANFLALYGRPGDVELLERRTGVTDGTGRAVIDIGPAPREHLWVVSRMRVYTEATTVQPTCTVYRLTPADPIESVSTVVAGTTTGDGDVAEGDPEVVSHPAYLRFVWENCDPDMTVGVAVELVQRPMVSQ